MTNFAGMIQLKIFKEIIADHLGGTIASVLYRDRGRSEEKRRLRGAILPWSLQREHRPANTSLLEEFRLPEPWEAIHRQPQGTHTDTPSSFTPPRAEDRA